jgi:hypothetical protein
MRDRRESARDKVIFGGVAEHGAHLEFSDDIRLAKKSWWPTIARKGRSVLAKIIWWRDNFVGVAFHSDSYELPGSDLAERLRASEKKKRQLQRRIKELIDEG